MKQRNTYKNRVNNYYVVINSTQIWTEKYPVLDPAEKYKIHNYSA